MWPRQPGKGLRLSWGQRLESTGRIGFQLQTKNVTIDDFVGGILP